MSARFSLDTITLVYGIRARIGYVARCSYSDVRAKLKGEQQAKMIRCLVKEGRNRVLAIVAGILVARHLKTTEDLFDSEPSPGTESLVASAVQWAERVMKKIDSVYR